MTVDFVEPEWAMATIAFVDIRGFTTFADRATAREAAAYLTGFFEVAVPVLAAHGGYVNKLLGDGMLTLFGAPRPRPTTLTGRSRRRALWWPPSDAPLDDRCRIGVGINSGLVLVGTMGAGHVMGLEVVGDPVNVASRVQDATRDMGEQVLITEATRRCSNPGGPELVSRGTISLRGKTKPIAVYGLAGLRNLSGRHASTSNPR